MVNIIQRTPSAPVVDQDAMQAFLHQWQVYHKLVEHDYLSHQGAGAALHKQLANVTQPFRFLDLACGDASVTVAALARTRVSHYEGIDLSGPALAMARESLKALACPVELEQRDFVAAIRGRQESADVVWIGLSLHHLQTADKEAFMRAVRTSCLGRGPEPDGVADEQGLFMIYEPVCREGESRAAYLDRFEAMARREWTELTPEEMSVVVTHVRTADLPEPTSVWTQLGRDAGFTKASVLFTNPGDWYTLFCFQP